MNKKKRKFVVFEMNVPTKLKFKKRGDKTEIVEINAKTSKRVGEAERFRVCEGIESPTMQDLFNWQESGCEFFATFGKVKKK